MAMSLTIKGFNTGFTKLFEKLAAAAIHEKHGRMDECMKLLIECNVLIVKKYRFHYFKENEVELKE